MKETSPILSWEAEEGKVAVLEATQGTARTRLLACLGAQAFGGSARMWLLGCDFEIGGPWSGLHDLFASLVEEIGLGDELVRRHTRELVHIVPSLRHSLTVQYLTLTDTADAVEKVRNYPADRAFRIVHGLIDFLDALKGRSDRRPWILACDGFERVSHIGRRFFAELMRRRGRTLPVTLLVTAAPGAAAGALESFRPAERSAVLKFDLGADSPAAVDREEAARAAALLEEKAGGSGVEIQIHLPELFRLWSEAGRPDRLFRLNCWGLEIYNSQGFYEDARVYGERAREVFETYAPGDEELFWLVFFKLFMCNLGLHDGLSAQKLLDETGALARVRHPARRGQLQYLVAMLHVRYLENRDLDKGEDHLSEGLRALEAEAVDPEYYHFFSVFNRNGLALVRHFQGRHEEALALCKSGFEELEAHLSDDRHRLHRSVLLYNMGQVYESIRVYDEAVRYYSAAMEMDPHYSEYYNDRGNVRLKMDNLDEARADYLRAIQLSPPYSEVWTNLGQCYRRMCRFEEAVEAYGVAIDLTPERVLAHLGRAQCHEALGLALPAIADYGAALELDPNLWDARAGRAILLFDAGDLDSSLADLDRAIELAPKEADLYQNRGILLVRMGAPERAREDFAAYLRLAPNAADREEVEARWRELGGAAYVGSAFSIGRFGEGDDQPDEVRDVAQVGDFDRRMGVAPGPRDREHLGSQG
jgi:tetratricopeptide (TPR) repeat protein